MTDLDPRIREWILSDDRDALLNTLGILATPGGTIRSDSTTGAALAEIGLVESSGSHLRLLPAGQRTADAAREYIFWLERERRLHGEGEHDAVSLGFYEDMDVLEVGPGWGCNLFRLAETARSVTGLEIDAGYIAFTEVFAQLERIDAPVIDLGRAERMPYEAQRFDRVVMFSALQYMDIEETFAEVFRVLRPGGMLLTTQALLGRMTKHQLAIVATTPSPRTALRSSAIVMDSVLITLFGRRIRSPVAGQPTARPIYPSARWLVRAGRRAGLCLRPDLTFDSSADVGLVFERLATYDSVGCP